MSDTITNPISIRLKASSRAIENGLGTGVGLGVVFGVLFPPLLPLSAGGAVFAALRTWRKEMERASELSDIERNDRISQLHAERSSALKQLAYGAAALQMETDELSLTLDVETGEADALILKGEYSGRYWSNLSKSEKVDAALLLGEAAAQLLKILAIAGSD